MKTKRRRLKLEQLERRALLAVMVVDPGQDENPAALLAEALSQANQTPEADTIQLSAGIYDLSDVSETPTLTIASDVTIVGASPSNTSIRPAEGISPIVVEATGSLDLSNVTVYKTHGQERKIPRPENVRLPLFPMPIGGIYVEGQLLLTNVAVIGLIQDHQHGQGGSLLHNLGKTEINNSIFVDGIHMGLMNEGEMAISGSTIANSSGTGVGSIFSRSLVIDDSILVRNHSAVSFSGDELSISGSSFTDNHGGGALAVHGSENNLSFDLDSTTNIIGNSHSIDYYPQNIDYPHDWSDQPESIGSLDAANQQVQDRLVSLDGNVLASDLDLEGVNVSMETIDGVTTVSHSGLGVSSVFWSPSQQRFLLSISQLAPDESLVAEQLPPIRLPPINSGVLRRFAATDVFTRDTLPMASDYNAWTQMEIQSVESTSGNNVAVYGDATWFRYDASGSTGQDTIIVTGIDARGVERRGELIIDVVSPQADDLRLEVESMETSDGIEMKISTTGGKDFVTSFNIPVGFNPEVVRLIDVEYGLGYPALRNTSANEKGSFVSFSAFRLTDPGGSHLATVQFERIGPGSANLRFVPVLGWEVIVGQENLRPSVLGIEYSVVTLEDVNRDGQISGLDVLQVINAIAREDHVITESMDLNRDGNVSAIDALRIINYLDRATKAEGSIVHPIYADVVLQGGDNEDEDPLLAIADELDQIAGDRSLF